MSQSVKLETDLGSLLVPAHLVQTVAGMVRSKQSLAAIQDYIARATGEPAEPAAQTAVAQEVELMSAASTGAPAPQPTTPTSMALAATPAADAVAPPKARVTITGDFGTWTIPYHGVVENGGNILLVYDTRYELGSTWTPPIARVDHDGRITPVFTVSVKGVSPVQVAYMGIQFQLNHYLLTVLNEAKSPLAAQPAGDTRTGDPRPRGFLDDLQIPDVFEQP